LSNIILSIIILILYAFSALMLLVEQQEGHPAYKKTKWWDAGVVICLERGADLHNYGPADATHCLLLQQNPDWFYLSGTGSPGWSQKKGR